MATVYLAVLVSLVCIGASLRLNIGGPSLNLAIEGDNVAYYGNSAKSYAYEAGTDLYYTHRWSQGKLVYAFAVNPGAQVSLKLRFMETYFSNPGKRVLSVRFGDTLNCGTMTLYTNTLDVFAEVGKNTAFNIPAGESDKLKFTSKSGVAAVCIEGVVENAMLSGLDMYASDGVRAISGNTGNTPPPPASKAPVRTPPPGPLDLGSWKNLATKGFVQKRHEACSVYMNGKVYLLGGRRINPVNVLDVATNTWTTKGNPPTEMHHVQCVAVPSQGAIYMVGAWTGGFPREKDLPRMHVYYPVPDEWGTKNALALPRRRGSSSAVLWKDAQGNEFIYIAGGNRGGHGSHANTLAEADRYNIKTDTWEQLPNMPNGRDHATGALVGSRFCVLGGRDGGASYPEFFSKNIMPVNCFDINKGVWLANKASIPVGRSGTMATSLCDGKHIMVVGGESCKGPKWQGCKAHTRADYYNVWTDKFVGSNSMTRARHSSGASLDCSCRGGSLKRRIYVPSGSGNIGGDPELTTTDLWTANSNSAC